MGKAITETSRPAPSSGPGAAVWLATAAGVGYAPLAPGTFGALVGVLLFLLFARLGLPLYLLTVAALSALGVWASHRAEQHFDQHDDGRIVIDEVAGQLVTLTPLVALGAKFDPNAFFGLVVTGFVLFRVFDIWKPGPVRWGERRFPGGLGVMMDDLIAGALGAAVLVLPAYAVWVGWVGGAEGVGRA